MATAIFYGAGHNARENFSRWLDGGLDPVCFADIDATKHHTSFESHDGKRLEILPLLEAIVNYPDYELYLTQIATGLPAVFRHLRGFGVPPERIKTCDGISIPQRPSLPEDSRTLYTRLQRIYGAIQDDLSKTLLFGRLEYSLSHNIAGIYRSMANDAYMRWISSKTTYESARHGLKGLWQLIKDNYPVQKNDIYLLVYDEDWNEYKWIAERFLAAMPPLGIKIAGCIMSNAISEIKEYMGVRCLNEHDLLNSIDENSRIIIGFPGWCLQTKDVVERFSAHRTILFPIADIAIPSYFENDIFQPTENEVFVDVGVYDLSNSIDFAKWAVKGYSRIYAFEPSPKCYEASINKMNTMDESFREKTELIQKGLGSVKGVLEFPVEYKFSGQFDSTVPVEVVSLDSFLDGKSVTFVKMDVDGVEMDVLLGMQETIRIHKPKLAVCIYHKHEDIFEIASYLLGLVPEYKLFIRHYGSNELETVLFCRT